jgi:hypothetical protein
MMKEYFESRWSDELKNKFKRLTPKQARTITAIVGAEAKGIAAGRIIRKSYSCRWCGNRSQNLVCKEKHEAKCQRRGQAWQFVISVSQFQRCCAIPEFKECLEQARLETNLAALDEAKSLLQMSAPLAARELNRQVVEGEKDRDRRAAATAILNRVDWEAGRKQTDQTRKDKIIELLEALRGVSEE